VKWRAEKVLAARKPERIWAGKGVESAHRGCHFADVRPPWELTRAQAAMALQLGYKKLMILKTKNQ